jgi:hypothetical protein
MDLVAQQIAFAGVGVALGLTPAEVDRAWAALPYPTTPGPLLTFLRSFKTAPDEEPREVATVCVIYEPDGLERDYEVLRRIADDVERRGSCALLTVTFMTEGEVQVHLDANP